jgi:hypothetical protein
MAIFLPAEFMRFSMGMLGWFIVAKWWRIFLL